MSASSPRWLLLCVFALLACGSAAVKQPGGKLKILGVFGHLGKSHFDVFKPLLEELARRGHQLTVISYFPRTEEAKAKEPLPNYKDISLFSKELGVFVDVVDLNKISNPNYRFLGDVYMINYMAQVACESGLNNPRVKEFVAAGEKFDLVITESFNTHCFYALFHSQGVPFIEISTHYFMPWVFYDLGFSSEVSYKPSIFSVTPRPLNFGQRMWNLFVDVFTVVKAKTAFHWRDQSFMEKYYGAGVPDVNEMAKNVSLVLVNTHYSIHGPHPYPPNVVEIGGLHIPEKPKPLPNVIQKFLDEATEGVLYLNLGSMVKAATMPQDKLTVLLNVLAALPRKVIMKWETDVLPRKLDNVLVRKWINQIDVLRK